jgi:hypothetical protein
VNERDRHAAAPMRLQRSEPREAAVERIRAGAADGRDEVGPSSGLMARISARRPPRSASTAEYSAALRDEHLGLRAGGAVLRIGGRELRFERRGGALVVRDTIGAAVVARGRAAEDAMTSAWEHLLAP